MSPKPDALRTFIAVVECGTLSSASVRLNRTPSAISTTLKQLESHFGGPLFDGDRKAQLTALGAYAVAQSRQALIDYDTAIRSVRHFAAGRRGRVRIATVPSVSARLLPDVVFAFQREAPEVDLVIRDSDSLSVAQLVRDGRVDIGIASQAQASPDLQAKQLLAEHFVLVCAVDNPLVSSELPITWARLEGERFIAHGLLNLIDHAKIKALVAEPAVTVHNITSIVSFVERGLGVTLLPSLAAPRNDAIAVLPLEDTSVTRNIRLLTRDSLSPAAAILAELISSRARDISLAAQR